MSVAEGEPIPFREISEGEPGASTVRATPYLASAAMVAFGVVLGWALQAQVPTASLPLIFVLPVVVSASFSGWGPALLATIAGVLAFDFFFTASLYSLTMDSPADLWSAALLLVVAGLVSTVSARARRREQDAKRAAERAQAIQVLAHAVVERQPENEILNSAAAALNRVFDAPAVIFREQEGSLRWEAMAGSPQIGPAVAEAARDALTTGSPVRGYAHPHFESSFDLWPVVAGSGDRFVLGVDFAHADDGRPSTPERWVEPIEVCLGAAV